MECKQEEEILIDMEWKREEEVQNGCVDHRKRVKPRAFGRFLGMFKQHFAGIPHSSLAALGNKERKAVEAHKLKVERARAIAIEYARHNTCR